MHKDPNKYNSHLNRKNMMDSTSCLSESICFRKITKQTDDTNDAFLCVVLSS